MHVVQGDIYRVPFKYTFHYAFRVGVLDHIPDPVIGFKSLASKVRPGGHLSVWVYGAENNGWILNLVNPVRERFTSRMTRRRCCIYQNSQQLRFLPRVSLCSAHSVAHDWAPA